MRLRLILAAAAAALLGAGMARPQTAATTAPMTAQMTATAQADAGGALFAARCAVCHGEAMTGGDHAPPLKGAAFWRHWQDAPARALYRRILSTMPASDPGSLSPDETLALVAHLARANGHALPAAVGSPDGLDAVTLAP